VRVYIIEKDGKLYYVYNEDKDKINAKIICEVQGLNIRIFGIEKFSEKKDLNFTV